MNKGIVIIANPVSGRGKARDYAVALQKCLESQGVQVHLQLTSFKGDGEIVAGRCVTSGVKGVIVCGGDGTIHEVVNGLKSSVQPNSKIPALSFFPAGRCNNLCKALGVSNDVMKVSKGVLESTERNIDLGKIGDRYFATVAALGLDSLVAEYVDQGRAPKFLKGTASYLYGLLAILPRFKFPSVLLKGDFGTFQGKVLLVAAGNTSSYGGGFLITPGATPDDGRLLVCIVRELPRMGVIKILPNVFWGRHIRDPRVTLQYTKTLTVDAEEPIEVWADGEQVGSTPVTIEIVASTLTVKLPAV